MRKIFLISALLALPLILLLFLAPALPVASAPGWQEAVDPWILETVAQEGEVEFFVFLQDQPDLGAAATIADKAARGAYVYEQLTATARRTQPAVTAELDRLGVAYRPYWIANMIWVRGDAAVVAQMARRDDVAHLYANPWVELSPPLPPTPALEREPLVPAGIEPNVALINAPDAWAAGITGEGVVVGGQDTGYDWDHPALKAQYRGWDGATADHNYHWHDAIHSNHPLTAPGNPCGFNSPVPCDDHGHGTHTMGTMVGDDGGANQIGVAPGARWIGCRNMEEGWGSPDTYAECFQWFVAPTDLQGNHPRPDLAPHVVNNSWTCPSAEGCSEGDIDVLLPVVANTRAAGIVVAAAAGNSGSSCSSIAAPPAIYDPAFTVGATTLADTIASFSSRGPVTIDSSNRLKPDIVAPGSAIRSSVPGTGYSYMSGTSMATPHVSGLVALLLQARPDWKGDVDSIEVAIRVGALPLTSNQGCGGDSTTAVPNNVYGHGRIDARATIAHSVPLSLTLHKTAPLTAYSGDNITYTLRVTNTHPFSITSGLVLTDLLPADTALVTATTPFDETGTQISWQRGSLGPGESWQITLLVNTPPTATGAVVNEHYGVSAAELNLIYGVPVTTVVYVSPTATVNLLVSKTAMPARAYPGSTLTYTLHVTNSSSFAASTGIVLSETLPLSVTLLGATTPFEQEERVLRWSLERLEPETGWSAMVVISIPITATGALVNETYGVSSNETGFKAGAPLVTPLLTHDFYLPWITRRP